MSHEESSSRPVGPDLTIRILGEIRDELRRMRRQLEEDRVAAKPKVEPGPLCVPSGARPESPCAS